MRKKILEGQILLIIIGELDDRLGARLVTIALLQLLAVSLPPTTSALLLLLAGSCITVQ